MELRPGYKETEIGVLPEQWGAEKLGKHATFRTGPFGSALHQSDYVDGGVPVINPMQIVDGKIVPTPSMAISLSAAQKLSDFRLEAGNVVIGRRGEMGRCAYVRDEEDGWLCGTGSMIIRTGSALDARFIQRVLSSGPIVTAIVNASVGSTMINLNQGTLGNLTIPIPPTKVEQEAIADALSDADALIDSLERLVAKKRQIKQGVTQELLAGKMRLPGFTGEWVVKALGEIGDSLIGLTYAPRDVRANGVLVLRSSNIFEGTLRFEDNVHVETDIPERIMVRQGDILICVRNGSRDLIGKCARIDERARGMTFGAFMAVFRTPYHGFVYHQFQSDLIKRQIREHLGATINQITNKSLNSFRVPLPLDLDEQVAVASLLNDMDAEVVALEEKLFKARQIKVALMQQLLTGRIRLV